MKEKPQAPRTLSRRQALLRSAGATALGAAAWTLGSPATADDSEPVARKGRVKQSLVNWCYRKFWPKLDDFCGVAKSLGCQSIELLPPKDWPTLKKHGLTCAIAGSHGFRTGMNNRGEWPMVTESLRKSIDASAEHGVRSVITFTGFANGIDRETGIKNCVEGFKEIVGYAEEKKVTLCLEVLNSRVDEQMKGHPGYQGDHTDYCMEIIRKVGSPRLKLLFDIYHVQIMDGDVIVRLRECGEAVGHVHTAGNPGRRELDDEQEINYKPILEALVAMKYDGFVGQEFIPTRDPFEGLREAVAVCDV